MKMYQTTETMVRWNLLPLLTVVAIFWGLSAQDARAQKPRPPWRSWTKPSCPAVVVRKTPGPATRSATNTDPSGNENSFTWSAAINEGSGARITQSGSGDGGHFRVLSRRRRRPSHYSGRLQGPEQQRCAHRRRAMSVVPVRLQRRRLQRGRRGQQCRHREASTSPCRSARATTVARPRS